MIEFWRSGGPNTTIESVIAAEAEGWDGQMFMDSQSLGPDLYVLMGACAMRTVRIKLSPGVTNPYTRSLAVTAAAIATLQSVSGGRAVLGIGRGDSALAYLGVAPVRIAAFERALKDLQALLGGERLTLPSAAADAEADSLDSLSLADRPTDFGLNWLPEGLPKTPLDVAATGPKVIEMASRIAERVTFSVGAIAERVAWAMTLARAARADASLPPVSYGAHIVVVCHRNREAALEMAVSAVAPLARFQVIQSAPSGPLGPGDAENLAAVRTGYDMNKHDKMTASKLVGSALTPEFIDRFAIAGPPDHCIERLRQLIRCGVERFVVLGPGFYPDGVGGARSLFAAEVMPALRAEGAV